MLKDIGIATQLGVQRRRAGAALDADQELWRAAAGDAAPEASVSELARWIERQTDTEITPGACTARRAQR